MIFRETYFRGNSTIYVQQRPLNKKTSLYQNHLEAKAKMVDFHGWDIQLIMALKSKSTMQWDKVVVFLMYLTWQFLILKAANPNFLSENWLQMT